MVWIHVFLEKIEAEIQVEKYLDCLVPCKMKFACWLIKGHVEKGSWAWVSDKKKNPDVKIWFPSTFWSYDKPVNKWSFYFNIITVSWRYFRIIAIWIKLIAFLNVSIFNFAVAHIKFTVINRKDLLCTSGSIKSTNFSIIKILHIFI